VDSPGKRVAVLAALIAGACFGPRVGCSPAEGGQAWIELSTAHYTVQTDLTPADARETGLYLERTRAALLAAGWPRSRGPEDNIKAFVLRDDIEFEQLFGQRFGGLFVRTGYTPFVLFPGKPANGGWFSEHVGRTVKHELTHHLSAYFLQRQPHWLSEGIASYLETIEISDDGQQAVVGHSHPRLLSVSPARVQELFAWNEDAVDLTRLYAGSWLLVHWMMNRKLAEFGDLQQRLIKGEEPTSAWANAFGGISLDRVNEELSNYRQHGTYQTVTVRLPAVDPPTPERLLPDVEVHAIRAFLVLHTRGLFKDESVQRLQLARKEADEALRQDAGNVSALQSMSVLQPGMREDLARRAVAAHPDDVEAWLMLADALRSRSEATSEREQALKKATSLTDKNAQAANELAFLYVKQGRFLAALPLAKRALHVAPWSSAVWDIYAAVAFGLRNCEEAIAAEHRALDLLPEQMRRSASEQFASRLRAYQGSCKLRAVQQE